ncbi:MAG: formylglycine-generating enzyme family protein [bacterium]
MSKNWKSQLLLGALLGLVSFIVTEGALLWYQHYSITPPPPAGNQAARAVLDAKPRDSMVLIPAGMFTRGTDPAKESPVDSSKGLLYTPYKDETPQKTFFLPAYYIDRYEVTIGEFRRFCEQTNRKLPELWSAEILKKGERLPAFGVTYEDAAAYASWVGKRLPTEGEWEKAARGPNGNRYVWGNEFDQGFLPSFKTLTPVGSNQIDLSFYGVRDLAGNVSEWTSGLYAPYRKGDFLERRQDKKLHVWRGYHFTEGLGGHYGNLSYFFRAAYRGVGEPRHYFPTVGFRCAKN